MAEEIDEGFGLGVRNRFPCVVKGLETPILDEIHDLPGEQEAVIIATVKCVAHADAVE